jgi:hypothetical protein
MARLLFIGLWNFSDDNGVHSASYVRVKTEIFPMDNCTIDELKRCISELITNELLREYVVDDKCYWQVTGWKQHQRIDRPTYRYPLPKSPLKQLSDESLINQRSIADYSSNDQRTFSDDSSSNDRLLTEPSPTEWNGMERSGEDKDTCAVETAPRVSFKASQDELEIFAHWQSVMKHPRARPDKKRLGKLRQALALGYTVDELKTAITGCSNTPFYMGQNDRGQSYDAIDLIFRDADHIDRFIANASDASLTGPAYASSTDLSIGAL